MRDPDLDLCAVKAIATAASTRGWTKLPNLIPVTDAAVDSIWIHATSRVAVRLSFTADLEPQPESPESRWRAGTVLTRASVWHAGQWATLIETTDSPYFCAEDAELRQLSGVTATVEQILTLAEAVA